MTALDNKERGNKPKRVPVSGLRDIMTVYNTNPDYVYRWVVDADERGGRIMKFLRGGYEFARVDGKGDKVEVGQDAVYKSKQDGSIVRLGTGGGKYSYLMRIRKEWYNEDQQEMQKSIDETEATITRTGSSEGEDFGQYGSIRIEH